MNVLVTGVAGFIGNAVAISLMQRGDKVIGIDNINSYYSVELKKARLNNIYESSFAKSFKFYKTDICNKAELEQIFKENKINVIVHLAAQAGVRYSLENPQAYIDSNITGTLNIFECSKNFNIKNIVFASSSSVYGDNAKIPFSTEDRTDNPVSLYAATKKSCELMANTYSHLFGLNITALRYFTVYGPWGRPDMAPILFAKNILENKPIKIFNNGNMKRDFTYISDIVNGTIAVTDWNIKNTSNAGSNIFNIGRGEPVDLMRFIEILENEFGKKAIKEFLPMQQGDVEITYSNTSALETATGYSPKISLEEGIKLFTNWFLKYNRNFV